MLALSVDLPFSTASSTGEDAVSTALQLAGTVSGGYAGAPCAFRRLGARARGLTVSGQPAGAETGLWVLVTIPETGESGHHLHLRERSLTAAQRFMLALACDGVDSQWVADVPSVQAFQDAGVDLEGHVPVGLVWCDAG